MARSRPGQGPCRAAGALGFFLLSKEESHRQAYRSALEDDVYFVDGIHDDILTQLAGISVFD